MMVNGVPVQAQPASKQAQPASKPAQQPKKLQVTASGMPAALTKSPNAKSEPSETPDGKPDPVKKALSDAIRKKEVEKDKEVAE